jgi:hypothetical protein
MATTTGDAQGEARLCPMRDKACVADACQWWVLDTGDKQAGGDCAMIYLALKKEPKWKYKGAT